MERALRELSQCFLPTDGAASRGALIIGSRDTPAMRSGAFYLRLLLIAGLAPAGRTTYVFVETQHQELPGPAQEAEGAHRSFDEFSYEQQANQLADGIWFKESEFLAEPGGESAAHPPLTALLLAPVSAATGGSVLAMRLVMALVGSAAVVLVGLVGREAFDARAGLWAAGLAAAYPNLWMNDGLVLSESLAVLCASVVIYLAYRLARSPGWRLAAALGAASGAGMLSRSELVLLLPLLVVPSRSRCARPSGRDSSSPWWP